MGSLPFHLKRLRQLWVAAAPAIVLVGARIAMHVVDMRMLAARPETLPSVGYAAAGWARIAFWVVAALPVAAVVELGTRVREADQSAGTTLVHEGWLYGFVLVLSGLALATSTLGWGVVPWLMEWGTTHGTVADLSISYGRSLLVGVWPLVLLLTFDRCAACLDRRRLSVYAALVMLGSDLAISWVIASGWAPAAATPTGVALGSAVSTSLGALVLAVGSWWALESPSLGTLQSPLLDASELLDDVRSTLPRGLSLVGVAATLFGVLALASRLDAHGWFPLADAASVPAGNRMGGVFALPVERTLVGLVDWPGAALLGLWPAALLWSLPPVGEAAVVWTFTGMAPLVAVTSGLGGAARRAPASVPDGTSGSDDSEPPGVSYAMALSSTVGLLYGLLLWFGGRVGLTRGLETPLVVDVAAPGLRILGAGSVLLAFVVTSMRALWTRCDLGRWAVGELLLRLSTWLGSFYLLAVVFDFKFIGLWISVTVYVGVLASFLLWWLEYGTWTSSD